MANVTTALIEHLLSQHARRAADRLAAASDHSVVLTEGEERANFMVASESIILVDSLATAARFVASCEQVLREPNGAVGLDLEWRPECRPDSSSCAHQRPSLLQLATRSIAWLLDLEADVVCQEGVLAVLAALLASKDVRKLGFGLQGDLDRLQLLYGSEHPGLVARRVVDLREACSAARHPSAEHPGTEGGLSVQMKTWTGQGIDKTLQCSDWKARPLTNAQTAYAAADAMCLHELDNALALWAQESGHPDPRCECDMCARPIAAAAVSAMRAPCPVPIGMYTPPPDVAVVASGGEDGVTMQALGDAGAQLVRRVVKLVGDGDACGLVEAASAPAIDAEEINALAFIEGSTLGPLLVLTPACSAKVDLRWLALALNCPKRRLRMASADECITLFGAIPGRVPPLPLRQGVRVLCDPRLANARELWGSSGGLTKRLVIRRPRFTLPALTCATASAVGAMTMTSGAAATDTEREANAKSNAANGARKGANSSANDGSCGRLQCGANGGAHGGDCCGVSKDSRTLHAIKGIPGLPDAALALSLAPFAWLPSPESWFGCLDDALDAMMAAPGSEGGEGQQPLVDGPQPSAKAQQPARHVRLIVDSSLSVLARKLRLLGVDTMIAGEVLRVQQPDGTPRSPACQAEAAATDQNERGAHKGRSLFGLLRVTIDASAVEAHLRRAALDGRLLVTVARRAKQPAPGAMYRLLAMNDAGKQLAELLTVLRLGEAVADSGGSRCGICNGDAWRVLRPAEVEAGMVPRVVLRRQPVFYLCGVCKQIFWPGDKYQGKMEGIRAETGEQATSAYELSAVDIGSGQAPAYHEKGNDYSEDAGSHHRCDASFRPSSRIVMAIGANSKQGGQMLREARTLHSTLRMQLEIPKVVRGVTYWY